MKYVLRAVDFSRSQERRWRGVRLVDDAQCAELTVYNRILRFWTRVCIYLPERIRKTIVILEVQSISERIPCSCALTGISMFSGRFQ